MTGLLGDRPILLVYGGSQGSQALNEAIIRDIDRLLKFCDVIHLTGKGKEAAPPQKGYWSSSFVHGMEHLYALADLALTRSGAGNVSELAANGIPALLVPLEGLAQDHQSANALAAQESGGCLLVWQRQLPEKLVPFVSDILANREKRDAMSQKIRALGNPRAADEIAGILLNSGRRGEVRKNS
jgi:UDP-N-acetylglucosamine--N-acetylmuramyl-(pentapeptide) pyrophosphoryl-undecaprenol N-acetylglucosamine transferase